MKNKMSKWDIARYIIGGIIALGSFQNIPEAYSFVGILFGISLFPIIYTKLNEQFKEKEKAIKTASIIIPIVLMIVFGSTIPEELTNQNNNGSINTSHNIKEETTKTNQNSKNDTTKSESKEKNIEIKLKSSATQNIKIGEKKEIKYSVSPWSARKEKAIFTSSNDEIVHVYEDGKIIGKSAGTAIVTLTIGNSTAEITVNVAKLTYELEGNLQDIAEVYYLNEARGNSTYFGKMVKITGKISDIDVDDGVIFNTGVTIWLDDSNSHYALACGNDDGIVGVKDLNKGDTVNLVGKMDTMAGSSLRMDDCEIYK